MIDAIRILFLAGVVVLAAALLPASPPTVAQTPCEADEYCHPDMMRACSGKSCRCSGCHSNKEICCMEEIIVR